MLLTSSSLSCDKTQSFLVDETFGEGISDTYIPFGRPVFWWIKGIQRKPLPAFSGWKVEEGLGSIL